MKIIYETKEELKMAIERCENSFHPSESCYELNYKIQQELNGLIFQLKHWDDKKTIENIKINSFTTREEFDNVTKDLNIFQKYDLITKKMNGGM